MSADLDAQLAECRDILTRPGFKCRTAAEHRAATRRDFLEVFTGEAMPEPPQAASSPESVASLAELLADLRRLEAEALEK